MSANLSAVPKLQFFDNNGNPLVGGKLYTYAAGTTTPQATFTDASATTPNTNPIILDSRGEANVWLSATTYKFVLTDATDATIWTVDNVSNSLGASQILAASGSAASPPYTFASDTSTGMYLAAVGQLGLTANGTPVLRSTDTQMVIGQPGGSNDVDVVVYGDIDTEGDFNLNGAFNLDGNLNITGAARRITGDFSTATLADRVMFQTSTVDGNTGVFSIPNGTGTNVSVGVFNSSNPTNSAFGALTADGANSIRVTSTTAGSGTALPLTFYTGTGGGAERMRISTSGNVGIGTINPLRLLSVNGDAAIQDITVGYGGGAVNSNTVFGREALAFNITGSSVVAVGYGALLLSTASNNTAVGRQALGGATSGANNTAVGYLAGSDIISGSGNTLLGYNADAGFSSATDRIVIGRDVDGTGNQRVTLGIGANKAELELDGVDTSWAASSDARLKTNVQDSSVGLDLINALRVVNFQWKRKRDVDPALSAHEDSDERVHGEGDTIYLGFIAQEAQAAITAHHANEVRLVRARDDGILTTAPAALVPVLVKAIQEQQAVIKSLVARITALESQ